MSGDAFPVRADNGHRDVVGGAGRDIFAVSRKFGTDVGAERRVRHCQCRETLVAPVLENGAENVCREHAGSLRHCREPYSFVGHSVIVQAGSGQICAECLETACRIAESIAFESAETGFSRSQCHGNR